MLSFPARPFGYRVRLVLQRLDEYIRFKQQSACGFDR